MWFMCIKLKQFCMFYDIKFKLVVIIKLMFIRVKLFEFIFIYKQYWFLLFFKIVIKGFLLFINNFNIN